MMFKGLIFSLLILLTSCDALRILVFFPIPSKSHSILGHGVVNNLLDAGHEVVHVTSFPREKTRSKLKEISLIEMSENLKKESEKTEMFKLKNLVGKGNLGDSLFFLYFGYELNRRIFDEPQIVQLLGDPKEKFDAAIVEWFFSDVGAGVATLLQCPLIWYTSTEAHWQVMKLIDEIPNPAYSVDIFSTYRPPLDFWGRLHELWAMLKRIIIYTLFLTPKEKSLYNKVFFDIAKLRGVQIASYNEAVYNGSFMLINSHPSVGIPYRLPQNAKYVAGHHIDNKVEPLSKDLQKLMDEAQHGVIYFSMGSNFKSSDMSEHMKESLLNMFGQLDQTVVWKFETDLKNMNIPQNVHLIKWAPQQSIFTHPNLRTFITHGGQLSTVEAMHFGVPVIGVPIVADQHVNMRSVENKGFGITVPLTEEVAVPLREAIIEMLSTSAYRDKVKELSLVYHDRIKPGEELVYWVELVGKTGGAPHLKSPAIGLSFYEKCYLDLLLLILILAFLMNFIVKIVLLSCKNFFINKEKTS